MTGNKSEKTALNYLADCVTGSDGARVLTVGGPMASMQKAIAAEVVNFAAGAAGTTGVVTIKYCPVFDATGAFIGSLGDSSFVWITGTILTTEVAYNTNLTDVQQLALLAQGQWALDYNIGRIRYCKKTAGVADTCNYTIRTPIYTTV